jgi:hypothetical protein
MVNINKKTKQKTKTKQNGTSFTLLGLVVGEDPPKPPASRQGLRTRLKPRHPNPLSKVLEVILSRDEWITKETKLSPAHKKKTSNEWKFRHFWPIKL